MNLKEIMRRSKELEEEISALMEMDIKDCKFKSRTDKYLHVKIGQLQLQILIMEQKLQERDKCITTMS
jgi:hypothetical protein